MDRREVVKIMTSRPRRFVGTAVIVCGGGTVLDTAVADRFTEEGAAVHLFAPRGAAEFAAIGQLVAEVRERYGRIDAVVTTPGPEFQESLWETDPADWTAVVEANLTRAYLTCHAVLPLLLEQGRGAVVNVTSLGGVFGAAGHSAHGAAAAGIVGLTRAAALDTAAAGVRVNCVCAGTAAITPRVAGRRPAVRVPRPEEVGAVVAYLASDEATFITGVAVPVDCGLTAQ